MAKGHRLRMLRPAIVSTMVAALLVTMAGASRDALASGPIAGPWTALGPAPIEGSFPGEAYPYSGAVRAVAADPRHAGTAYIGGDDGGVWKTTDDGTSWTPVFDQSPSLQVASIAVDPVIPNIMYVGTGGADGADRGAGLFRCLALR